MESIISKLYYGEISPCGKPAPDTESFRDNRAAIHNAEEKLLKQFPKSKEILNEYTDALRIEAQLESEADFARGFRLGIMIMLDVMATEYRMVVFVGDKRVYATFRYE